MAKQADILLGNLEDAIPVDSKEAGPRGPDRGRQGGRLRRHPALDARQLAREPLGARRPHPARHRDRRQARGDHGPEGRGPVGHPLRRPPPGPARGEGRPRAAAAHPRDPRDLARRRQPRGDRHRQPPDAGDELRPGGPGRVPAHEDHPRRRRPPRLPGDRRTRIPTIPTRRESPPSRTHGTTRSPAWSTPAPRPGSCPSTGPTATSRTSWAARRSSAPPSCSAASAPGRCTRSRSRSPRRSSARRRTRSSSPRRCSRRSPTAAAST